MIAGSGIVHSEREPEDITIAPRRLHGLQLWLALPEKDEETTPDFLHYSSVDMPSLTLKEVPIRVMIGHAYGITSPVKTFAQTLYVEAELNAAQTLVAPDGVEELAVYVAKGSLRIGEEKLPEFSLVILNTERPIQLTANENSRIAFIGGENIGPRYIWWNFVSSRKERIEQAKDDWREGR